MRIITLNTWGGKLFDSLCNFLKEKAKSIDIFCFQEMYSSPMHQKIGRDMRANLFQEIAKILKDHIGYFAPHLQGHDLDGRVSFDLKSGLAIFIRKTIQVTEVGDIFIYREGIDLLDEDKKTVPRNLQFVTFTNNKNQYVIGHFHGIWYPKSKIDTTERIEQSKKINEFFNAKSGKKILCGDFNLLPNTESMKLLETERKNLIREFNIATTRNHYYQREEKHADYVLVTPDVNVKEFKVFPDIISDHSALLLEFD